MLGMAEASGRPLSISVTQADPRPARGATCSTAITDANERGLRGHRPGRRARRSGSSSGCRRRSARSALRRPRPRLIGLRSPSARPLRDADIRATILAERRARADGPACSWTPRVPRSATRPTTSRARARASRPRPRRRGVAPEALAYDLLLADGGTGCFYVPLLNYADGDLEPSREMLTHPHAVLGLGRRRRARRAHLRRQLPHARCSPTGCATGPGRAAPARPRRRHADRAHRGGRRSADRGVLAPGMQRRPQRDRLRRSHPATRRRSPSTCPAGGKRLLQRADGYLHTFVAGEETYASASPPARCPAASSAAARPRPA